METVKIPDVALTLTADRETFMADKTTVLTRQTGKQQARLKHAVRKADFFELFGAIKDETFVEPDDVNAE